ncbi:MAG: leucine-rich repeat protein [Muribaculaceae bacterium]|nr:leucine-rich repeat protein [Muribaculaceae bacterium]
MTSIGWEAFRDCSGFTGSLTIGNSLTEIGTYAFSGCSGFTGSLTIPKSVKTIGDYAFDVCSGFSGSLTIPNSVTYIGRSAFYACSGFSGSLTIPNSVKTIGGDAFYGCSGLSSLILAGNGELKVKHLSVLSFNTVLIQSGITGIKGLRLSPKDKVYSYATTPPTCDENAFTQYTAALHVPKMSLAAYASAPYWSNFSNITADAGESVGDVNGDGVVDIDDLNVVINIMVHKAAMADWPMADVDGNGYVDIDDLNVVVNFIVGKDGGGSHEQGDWVDLGLSSGTLWATRNIGASSPEDYGDYFAWGETAPKDVYMWNWENYKWYSKYFDEGDGHWHGGFTKYCSDEIDGFKGFVDNKTELDLADDAAAVNWGGSARMPSLEQIQELVNECDWHWEERNGVWGRLATGPNGNTIFFPAAGCKAEGYGSPWHAGDYGFYWSYTSGAEFSSDANYLYFNSDSVYWLDESSRYGGFTIRAVRVP